MKKVSIIIPVYNVEKYVEQCLDSVVKQTYPNVEIIIVENGSTDNTLMKLEKYRSMGNVTIIVQNQKLGPGGARNIGMMASTGDYVAFIDGDDIVEPNMIEEMVRVLEQKNSLVVMCRHDVFIGCLKRKGTSKGDVIELDFENRPSLLEGYQGQCWNKLYRRELLEKFPFPNDLNFEDAAVIYPILILSQKVPYITSELYHYRRNIKGITLSNKFPNKRILDLYPAINCLEQNYSLVRTDNRYDYAITNIAHHILLISAIDAACWLTIPYPTHKKIVSELTFLANRRYGYNSYLENPIVQRNLSRWIYFARIQLFKLFLDSHYQTDKSDIEIMDEVSNMIDSELAKRPKQKIKY